MAEHKGFIDQIESDGTTFEQLVSAHSVNEIADKYDVSVMTVRYHLKRRGFMAKRNDWRKLEAHEIVSKFKEVGNVKKTASELGIKYMRVYEAIAESILNDGT